MTVTGAQAPGACGDLSNICTQCRCLILQAESLPPSLSASTGSPQTKPKVAPVHFKHTVFTMDLHSTKAWLFPFTLFPPDILVCSCRACLHISVRLTGHERAQTITYSGDLLVTYSHRRSVSMEKNPPLGLILKPAPKPFKSCMCWERSYEDKPQRVQLGCCRWFRSWEPGSHP